VLNRAIRIDSANIKSGSTTLDRAVFVLVHGIADLIRCVEFRSDGQDSPITFRRASFADKTFGLNEINLSSISGLI
jgi:hypothetical protein